MLMSMTLRMQEMRKWPPFFLRLDLWISCLITNNLVGTGMDAHGIRPFTANCDNPVVIVHWVIPVCHDKRSEALFLRSLCSEMQTASQTHPLP